ncbi:MAG: WYL domain-containing protein, partial [Bdellovibrio sp.]|nr:WYL domain-containing protein [Bdellovibrio sp.]
CPVKLGGIYFPQSRSTYVGFAPLETGQTTWDWTAFFEMKVLKIFYKDEQGRITERDIEAQYLLLSWPLWYVMAWDRLRNDIRSLRVDRIQKAQILNENFRMHRQERFIEIFKKFSESL